MKITQINAYTFEGNTEISLSVTTDLSVSDAISSVLALFAGERGIGGTGVVSNPEPTREQIKIALASQAAQAEANIIDEPTPAAVKATRTRRPRTNPDAAPSAPTTEEILSVVAADAPVVTERRRTRVTAEPSVPEVKVITDADLAKACSNAAAIVGIEVVQAVIADFHVGSMQELAPDVREKFLGELEDEIRLAKEELAAATGASK